MKIVRSFLASVPDAVAIERITGFFTQSGYRQLPVSEHTLQFKRGSMFGTISSFDPSHWACTANIRIIYEDNASNISAEIEIDTDPTEKQFAEELLSAEFLRLVAAVTKNEFSVYDPGNLKKKVISHVSRTVGIFAGSMISVILGIASGQFCSKMLNIPILTSALIGLVVLLISATVFLAVFGRAAK